MFGHKLILGGHSFIAPLGNDALASPAEQAAIVGACLQAGITAFDTTYEPERIALGAALAAVPAGLRAGATPILWNFFGEGVDPLPGPAGWTEARFAAAVKQVDVGGRVPALVVHPVGPAEEDAAQRRLAREWKAAGRISALGVWAGRGWDTDIESAAWDFVVTPYNPTCVANAEAVFGVARARGLKVVATSPFVRGWELDKVAARVGAEMGVPAGEAKPVVADLLLRFAAHDERVDHLVVSMRRAVYVGQNVGALGRGPLTAEERRRVLGG